MHSQPGKTKFQVDLRQHLRDQNISGNMVHLICEIAEASKYVINAIRTGDLGVAGTSNLYGEEQLALDESCASGCSIRAWSATSPPRKWNKYFRLPATRRGCSRSPTIRWTALHWWM